MTNTYNTTYLIGDGSEQDITISIRESLGLFLSNNPDFIVYEAELVDSQIKVLSNDKRLRRKFDIGYYYYQATDQQ
jgi:hypothetical protein